MATIAPTNPSNAGERPEWKAILNRLWRLMIVYSGLAVAGALVSVITIAVASIPNNLRSLDSSLDRVAGSFWELVGGSDALISLLCAELFLFLVRRREITIFFKSDSQRTTSERQEVARGLGRALILESALFAPASLLLVLITARPILIHSLRSIPEVSNVWIASILGVIGYNFPFAAAGKGAKWIVMHILQRFVNRPSSEAAAESPQNRP
jgi:hypothetical protein